MPFGNICSIRFLKKLSQIDNSSEGGSVSAHSVQQDMEQQKKDAFYRII